MQQKPNARGVQKSTPENETVETVSIEWEFQAKRLLKAELAHAGVTYKGLVKKLEAIGVEDNEAAIANRVSRGKFSFVFFLQCMRALGVAHVDVRERGRG